MKVKSNSIILVYILFFTRTPADGTPNWLETCKENDDILKTCIRKLFYTLKYHLPEGVEELKIPPLEPIVLPQVEFEETTQEMDYKARLKELRIYGISSYRISDIIIDRSEGKATVKLDVPVVRLGADYEVKGSYLGEPIQGSGRFNTNLTKFSVDITIKVNATDVETEECCRMKETEVAIQMATGRGYFSDMYTDAYTEPSKATNSFLEAHALDILREVKPAVESIISLLVEEIGNRIETFTPHYTIFRRT